MEEDGQNGIETIDDALPVFAVRAIMAVFASQRISTYRPGIAPADTEST
jgi:hypothetical protein